jgi:hypothetical protein
VTPCAPVARPVEAGGRIRSREQFAGLGESSNFDKLDERLSLAAPTTSRNSITKREWRVTSDEL